MSVADKLQTLQNIKTDIKTSILNKGIDVNDDFTTYADAIDSITTGGGSGRISVAETGIKFGSSTFSEIPDYYDFSNITDFSYMFYNCTKLKTINQLDTSNVTTMNYTFYNCGSLTTLPDKLITTNVTTMTNMFYNCSNLTYIPELDTTNVTTMTNMFYNCSNLTYIPELYSASVTTMTNVFGYSNLSKLNDVGGWKDLKCRWNGGNGLEKLPNLTYQSCINILNGLYDFVGNGETPNSSQGILKVHSNFLTLVGDEISIGINKGWTITA